MVPRKAAYFGALMKQLDTEPPAKRPPAKRTLNIQEKLKALHVSSAKSRPKPYKLSDGNALYLLITPAGAKLWRWNYRFEGRQKTMALGAYPVVSLKRARKDHKIAVKLLATGVDPMAAHKAENRAKKAENANSFEAVARLWWAHWRQDKNERHADYVLTRLQADVFPAIGARPVSKIETPELVSIMKAIERRGALDIARRAFRTCGQIFRYAIANGMAARNPASDISPSDVLKPRIKTNMARVSAPELPGLLRAIAAYPGTPQTRLAMQFMALTFVRTNELLGARWAEIDFEARRWNLPPERTKMKTPHVVYLADQTLELLRVLHVCSGHSELLFPGQGDPQKPMSNGTILMALRRMGYSGKMTGHGFRGVASTILHELGFDHAHIELQLSHSPRDAISAAYNHALYLPQRAKMLQAWANHLDAILRSNVVPLRAAG